jgi:hypothetical protein
VTQANSVLTASGVAKSAAFAGSTAKLLPHAGPKFPNRAKWGIWILDWTSGPATIKLAAPSIG